MRGFSTIFIFLLFAFSSIAQVVRKDTATMRIVTPSSVQPQAEDIEAKEDSNLSLADEFRKDSYKFQWGLRGSLSRSQLQIAEVSPIRVNTNGTPLLVNGKLVRENLLSNPLFATGFSAGAFGRISRGSFFIQPEVVFAQKRGNYDVLDNNQQLKERIKAQINLIDVPILLGIKFRKIRAFTGPVASFAYSLGNSFRQNLSQYTTQQINQEFLKRPIINFMSGIGVEFKQIFFDVRYESGLSNYTNVSLGPESNPSPFYFSTNVIYFSVGIIRL